MIKVQRIDHVAIAVPDRDEASRRLVQLFGLCEGVRETVSDQKTDVAFLHAGDAVPAEASAQGRDEATAIELVAPAGNAGLDRFLASRGPGLHHVCFEVDDLPGTLRELKAAGVRLLDEAPRPGARGHMVAFLHPASTGGVLFELCAHAPGSVGSTGSAGSKGAGA
jgi:methylmalonyl-CoA/ethylmalonyl-CoA epimerase